MVQQQGYNTQQGTTMVQQKNYYPTQQSIQAPIMLQQKNYYPTNLEAPTQQYSASRSPCSQSSQNMMAEEACRSRDPSPCPQIIIDPFWQANYQCPVNNMGTQIGYSQPNAMVNVNVVPTSTLSVSQDPMLPTFIDPIGMIPRSRSNSFTMDQLPDHINMVNPESKDSLRSNASYASSTDSGYSADEGMPTSSFNDEFFLKSGGEANFGSYSWEPFQAMEPHADWRKKVLLISSRMSVENAAREHGKYPETEADSKVLIRGDNCLRLNFQSVKAIHNASGIAKRILVGSHVKRMYSPNNETKILMYIEFRDTAEKERVEKQLKADEGIKSICKINDCLSQSAKIMKFLRTQDLSQVAGMKHEFAFYNDMVAAGGLEKYFKDAQTDSRQLDQMKSLSKFFKQN